MYTREHRTALMATLLLIPFLALAACEGYEEPGTDQTGTQEQEEMQLGQDEQAAPGQQQDAEMQQGEMDERTQRREAEPATGDRPEEPAAPTTDEAQGEAGASAERLAVTEVSTELPENLSEGNHTLTCQVPSDAFEGAAQQEGEQEIDLSITVERDAQGQRNLNQQPR